MQEGVLNIAFRVADDEKLPLRQSRRPARDHQQRRRARQGAARPSTATSRQLRRRHPAPASRARASRAPTASSASPRSTSWISSAPHRDGRGDRQHARRRQADGEAAPLRDVPAVDADRAVADAARSRRPADKPKLVFFFDEAHLLFDDAPKALLDRIEQIARLDPLEGRRRLLRHAESRSTCPTPSPASSATAFSTRCAPSRRKSRRR